MRRFTRPCLQLLLNQTKMTLMHRLFRLSLCTFLLLAAGPAIAAEAEIVWTKFDGKQHQIVFSAYDGEHWLTPGEVVYSSANPLATPVIGTLPSGEKLLIWAEIVRKKVKLMYSQSITAVSRTWADADVFSDIGKENLAPTLVTDLNDHVWVFWSSSSSLPSDIYMRKFDGSDWSKAERIHSANQVPDNSAHASLNTDGNIYLEWNTFDFEINDYRLDSKTFITENPYPDGIRVTDTLNPADIPSPDFIGFEARAVIHFPNNKLIQNQVLNN